MVPCKNTGASRSFFQVRVGSPVLGSSSISSLILPLTVSHVVVSPSQQWGRLLGPTLHPSRLAAFSEWHQRQGTKETVVGGSLLVSDSSMRVLQSPKEPYSRSGSCTFSTSWRRAGPGSWVGAFLSAELMGKLSSQLSLGQRRGFRHTCLLAPVLTTLPPTNAKSSCALQKPPERLARTQAPTQF